MIANDNKMISNNYITGLIAGKSRAERGFTLFFAVLIGSLLLAIGMGIFSITIKELTLSFGGRLSQSAFYAADAGAECALYWDYRAEVFPSPDSTGVASGVVCGNQNISEDDLNEWMSIYNEDSVTTKFVFYSDKNDTSKPCAFVLVEKTDTTTKIELRGQNTCSGASALRVERGIRIQY